MNNAYSVLSKVYEYLICDCDYENWSQYVLSVLKKYAKGSVGVDCASGSGYFTRAMKRAGYDVLGVDFSAEMLSEAMRKTASEGLDITYLQMDMSKLKLMKKVDFITVINDGINYVSPENIQRTFNAFARNLKKDGIVFFDFSSEYKIKNIIGNNLFGEDDENVSYLWFNKQGDGFVDMDLVLFLKDGEKYVKREESHRQFAHKTDFICNCLKQSGLEIVNLCEHLGGRLTEQSERVEIIARKV